MANGTPTTRRKVGEAGVGLTLATAVGFLLAWINPEVPPESVAFLAGLAGVAVTSGTSFLRRYAVAYDSKFLKVLLGIGLVLVFAGCGTTRGQLGRVNASGDSMTDVALIDGECTMSNGVWLAESEDDNGEPVVTPIDGWVIRCQDGGRAEWHFAESLNAELTADVAGKVAEGVVKALVP